MCNIFKVTVGIILYKAQNQVGRKIEIKVVCRLKDASKTLQTNVRSFKKTVTVLLSDSFFDELFSAKNSPCSPERENTNKDDAR